MPVIARIRVLHKPNLGVPVAALSVLSLCLWALASCATVITPQAGLSEPVDVFVVDHGRTTSLIIPASDGRLLRYAYGDWNWYALGHHGSWNGISALFWPSEAGFGRGVLEGPATIDGIRARIRAEEILPVPVDRTRLRAFEKRMEALYDSGRDGEVSNPEVGLSFVHDPQPYSAFSNSNHAVASWLRELGSKTRGFSFGANWRVSTEPDR